MVSQKDPNGHDNGHTVEGVEPPLTPRVFDPPPKRTDDTIELDVLESGTAIGRYIIKKVIGRGGMGVVYVAHDPGLNRRIAIKILHTNKGSDSINDPESARTRLLREAQAMAAIGHPNLVQVHDVGTYQGAVFIAMEFVNGRTLREWSAETTSEDWEDILQVFIAAGEALHAAHEAKLIHRDFKPDNVMLGFDSRVRVMDFGLARSTGERKASDSATMNTSDILGRPLTATGMIMGTPAYMAPEQFLGEPTDARTDQFAFCVSLFEALYGYRPFQGKNMTEVAKAVMRGKIKLPPKSHPAPDHILDALLQGLQCTPEDRHESMAALLAALQEPPRKEFYHPWILYILVGLIAAGGIGLYFYSAHTLNEAKRRIPESEPTSETPTSSPDEARWLEKRSGVLHSSDLATVRKLVGKDTETCIARAEHPSEVTGRIAIEILLDEQGKIESWRADGDLFDRSVSRCILGLAGGWRFPSPVGGPAKVTIPIHIKDGKPFEPHPEAGEQPIIPEIPQGEPRTPPKSR